MVTTGATRLLHNGGNVWSSATVSQSEWTRRSGTGKKRAMTKTVKSNPMRAIRISINMTDDKSAPKFSAAIIVLGLGEIMLPHFPPPIITSSTIRISIQPATYQEGYRGYRNDRHIDKHPYRTQEHRGEGQCQIDALLAPEPNDGIRDGHGGTGLDQHPRQHPGCQDAQHGRRDSFHPLGHRGYHLFQREASGQAADQSTQNEAICRRYLFDNQSYRHQQTQQCTYRTIHGLRFEGSALSVKRPAGYSARQTHGPIACCNETGAGCMEKTPAKPI